MPVQALFATLGEGFLSTNLNHEELASLLAAADAKERAALLTRHQQLVGVELAWALKDKVFNVWTSDPPRALNAANALTLLSSTFVHPEISALASWTSGIAALVEGQMEQAIEHLDESATRFQSLNKSHSAASTQISKLMALSMLGRYDEAIEQGLQARDVLLSHEDELAAGKIELNLGNLYFRRDQYNEAETFFRTARNRLVVMDDPSLLTMIDNGLANSFNLQHRFREAELLYEQALARSEKAGLDITQAEIECNIGDLALFQGRFDRALDYLERSRRRYASLDMPHESAVAELELADAYLELNLAPEAATLYERVIPIFLELGMRAERARAVASYGKTCLLLKQPEKARALLTEAYDIYQSEGNAVGMALVALIEAQAYYAESKYSDAIQATLQAEEQLSAAGHLGLFLLACLIRGESNYALGQYSEARKVLEQTLQEAQSLSLLQIAQRCYTALGALAIEEGHLLDAEKAFKQAIVVIEELRAPLPAEDFHTAFVEDKLIPYTALVRLCLADKQHYRVTEALEYIERARSRALFEMLGGTLAVHRKPQDDFEADLLTRLGSLREELSWYYSQINHPSDSDSDRTPETMAKLYDAVRERERAVAEINRQLNQRNIAEPDDQGLSSAVRTYGVETLQGDLGPDTALIEYFSIDGELLAFVMTSTSIDVVRNLGRESQVESAINQLRFQTDSLRHGMERMRGHLDQLSRRAQHYLHSLYDVLLEPIEKQLDQQRLVIVPHRALNYVPFQALYDGEQYVIERREICYAPSSSILHYCLTQPQKPLEHALLLGVPDERVPRVRDEVNGLASLFPQATALLDEEATIAALREQVATADILHLACHGWFRPDNPLFSSLKLGDGWLTVRDTYSLDVNCSLVTLSACETGVHAVAPGDELLGIARGFFSAGIPSLLVSLWAVDDESTATLMQDFYTRLCAGDRPAAALRHAQCNLLKQYSHPFFWSPFVLLGRW
ncbi:MAG: CHAT domain-containing tetratricopeptide repeat protein [Chloroflexota bacterium]